MRWFRRHPVQGKPDPDAEHLALLADALRSCQASADRAVAKFPDLAHVVTDAPRWCSDPACPKANVPHTEHGRNVAPMDARASRSLFQELMDDLDALDTSGTVPADQEVD